MTDYSTLKVTELKDELKKRGIPQTNLRRKHDFIKRLEDDDANGQEGGAEEEETQPAEPEAPTEAEEAGSYEAPQQDVSVNALNATEKATKDADDNARQRDAAAGAPTAAEEAGRDAPPQDTATTSPAGQAKSAGMNGKTDENTAQTYSAHLNGSTDQRQQLSQAGEPNVEAEEHRESDARNGAGDKQPKAETATQAAEEKEARTEVVDGSDAEAISTPIDQAPGSKAEAGPSVPLNGAKQPDDNGTQNALPGAQTSGANTALSTPLPAEEFIDDVRKRKRRSQSPVPPNEEVARKRAKVLDEQSSIGEGGGHDDQAGKAVFQKQDMRFKGLLSSTGREQTRQSPPPSDADMEDVTVEPARHAATAALYISGLMRPLQLAALRNHLLSVVSTSKEFRPDLIIDLHLDSIKTHCFVRFEDVPTAMRARNRLHGTVWPNEKSRKKLSVDFVPVPKLREWIKMEEEAELQSGRPLRWQVVYEERGDGVEATLEHVGSEKSQTQAFPDSAQKEFTRSPPRGPRAETQVMDRPTNGASQASGSSQPAQNFKPLDELFKSTASKPMLFYLPVPRAVADQRLDRFDDLLRKGPTPRPGGDETRKYSFEDDDQFVDRGPEFPSRGQGGIRRRGRGGGMFDRRDTGRGH
ncbi:SAP domain protein [Aspergillus mulundensis]|uniref:SAP domain-containing protein n=1 Tax=Aspergillus mulundensis TaxID=1810919 RepID=A0A3D8RXH6_9EURO|nr:hypothetical protein DSM5745_05577 [Aspergillus mulundensis]RDW78725.1 hypothetical protein DSM5745_05577 [Aspergillus mulundensis]